MLFWCLCLLDVIMSTLNKTVGHSRMGGGGGGRKKKRRGRWGGGGSNAVGGGGFLRGLWSGGGRMGILNKWGGQRRVGGGAITTERRCRWRRDGSNAVVSGCYLRRRGWGVTLRSPESDVLIPLMRLCGPGDFGAPTLVQPPDGPHHFVYPRRLPPTMSPFPFFFLFFVDFQLN